MGGASIEGDREESALVARRAAELGSRIITSGWGTVASSDPSAKDRPGDWVTEVDLASEAAIVELLAEATPGIPVVGEESGGHQGGRHWLVDPLDGTTNFVHGFSAVGVSVALVEDGVPVAGAVAAPLLGEMYWGSRGSGAFADRGRGTERLHVSERPPDRAVVATGFPFRHKELLPRYLPVMEAALHRFEDLRRPGAACLDLAWVAAGVFDGFFELALSSWDVAAGGLLIEEAGGVVTDWNGGTAWMTGDILAGSAAVHAGLLELARASTRTEGGESPPSAVLDPAGP
jgi:myo-inositol-1(or 4)-monophosphatase